MKPSPPSATMTAAASGAVRPYSASSSASACWAAGASLATKAMLPGLLTPVHPRSGDGRRSTARDAHVAADGRAVVTPVDDEIMALGLARYRGADRLLDRLVALGKPQRRA